MTDQARAFGILEFIEASARSMRLRRIDAGNENHWAAAVSLIFEIRSFLSRVDSEGYSATPL
jgi:hypothetical protein